MVELLEKEIGIQKHLRNTFIIAFSELVAGQGNHFYKRSMGDL